VGGPGHEGSGRLSDRREGLDWLGLFEGSWLVCEFDQEGGNRNRTQCLLKSTSKRNSERRKTRFFVPSRGVCKESKDIVVPSMGINQINRSCGEFPRVWKRLCREKY